MQGERLERWRGRFPAHSRPRLAAAWLPLFIVATVNGVFLFIVPVVLLFAFDFDNADVLLSSFGLAVVLLVVTSVCAIVCDLGRAARRELQDAAEAAPAP